MKKFHNLLLGSLICLIVAGSGSCSSSGRSKKEVPLDKANNKHLITFVELGSVNCIPCKQMQPVMKAIEEKFGDRVKVVFHDVWTDTGAPFAKEFGVKSIPTQVFLDEDGNEFFRHTGFFPEEEVIKVLNSRGVN